MWKKLRLRSQSHETKPRYYLYVSDSKIDMLFAQIPKRFLTRIAAELSLDLKVVGVKLSERPSDENRYSRLRVVEQYVRSNYSVGTLEEPNEYFEGALPMHWGVVEYRAGTGAAYFTAATEQTLVALGGSLRHVIGGVDSAPKSSAVDSSAWGILSLLGNVARTPEGDLEFEEREIYDKADNDKVRFLLNWVYEERQQFGLFGQQVEFLAKLLAQETDADGHPPHVVLGSPIYVALSQ